MINPLDFVGFASIRMIYHERRHPKQLRLCVLHSLNHHKIRRLINMSAYHTDALGFKAKFAQRVKQLEHSLCRKHNAEPSVISQNRRAGSRYILDGAVRFMTCNFFWNPQDWSVFRPACHTEDCTQPHAAFRGQPPHRRCAYQRRERGFSLLDR